MSVYQLPDNLPVPVDDGACGDLQGTEAPALELESSIGPVNLAQFSAERAVLYVYPRTGRADRPVPEGWDAIPGAERDEDLRARVTTTVLGFGAAHIDQTVAVVSHGGAINACLAGLLEINRSHIAAIENTSITTVHLRDGAPARLITMNDCNHIYDPVLGPLG